MTDESSPRPVGEILDQLFSRLGIESRIKELRLLKYWEEIVGKAIAQHSHPVAIHKGNLFVKVDSSAWMAQITYFKEKIISEFNRREQDEIIKDIYLRLGKISPVKRKKQTGNGLRAISLQTADLKWIEKITSRLEDKNLKKVIRRILIKDKRLKKRRAST